LRTQQALIGRHGVCAATTRLVSLHSRRGFALGLDYVAKRSVNHAVNSLHNEESAVVREVDVVRGLLQNYAWFNADMCAWMTAMHSDAQNTPTIFITDPVTMADLELDKILYRFAPCRLSVHAGPVRDTKPCLHMSSAPTENQSTRNTSWKP
jgi:hypothetical protein